MTYRDTLIQLSQQCEGQAKAVFQMYLDGDIDAEECIQLLANVVAANNSRAVALAVLSLAATLMVDLGTEIPVEDVLPRDGDLDRLLKATRTVLEIAADSDVPEAIVGRLGRAEPLEAAASAYSEAIKTNTTVRGWVRDTGGECCQLCEWWSRNGRIWPNDHVMPTHKGCECVQLPVTKEN